MSLVGKQIFVQAPGPSWFQSQSEAFICSSQLCWWLAQLPGFLLSFQPLHSAHREKAAFSASCRLVGWQTLTQKIPGLLVSRRGHCERFRRGDVPNYVPVGCGQVWPSWGPFHLHLSCTQGTLAQPGWRKLGQGWVAAQSVEQKPKNPPWDSVWLQAGVLWLTQQLDLKNAK